MDFTFKRGTGLRSNALFLFCFQGRHQDACVSFGLVAHSLTVFLIMFMPKVRPLNFLVSKTFNESANLIDFCCMLPNRDAILHHWIKKQFALKIRRINVLAIHHHFSTLNRRQKTTRLLCGEVGDPQVLKINYDRYS